MQLDQVALDGDVIVIAVQANAPSSSCPLCGQPSDRIHSRYTRTLADLPWHGKSVRLELRVRRFFCLASQCARRIFAERLPKVAKAYARTTDRLHEAHRLIALALGGEAGSRLATSLAMATSADTLLRRIENLPRLPSASIRVLGVDDWAWRRGHRYGTILCDLERHRPVDLLRERSAQALRDWLKHHPEIRIISRDRADDYIKGASDGAPQAVQVADRWHLLRNLREMLTRILDRHHATVRQAARSMADKPAPTPPSVPPRTRSRRNQARSESRRARRLQRFEEVKRLHGQGIRQRTIAKQLGMHRSTVRRFIRALSFPERAPRQGYRRADPSEPYLKRRWAEGCRNAALLARELRAQGIKRSDFSVRRQVASWRERLSSDSAVAAPRSINYPSSRRVACLLLKKDDALEADEQVFLQNLQQQSSELQVTAELARDFSRMVRQRQHRAWNHWLTRACAPGAAKELRTFAEGLQKDAAAVKAALKLKWSNGQVEGQVNRLKMLKRQMYGRAGFDLLRQRVLLAH